MNTFANWIPNRFQTIEFWFEMGISFTDPAEHATWPAWTAIRSRVAGAGHPRTFQEMEQWFRDEAACRTYTRHLRWPGGSLGPCRMSCRATVVAARAPPELSARIISRGASTVEATRMAKSLARGCSRAYIARKMGDQPARLR